MSSGWGTFITVVTLLSMAGTVWLLIANRDKDASGEELDHDFDGIRELDNPLPAWWVTLFFVTVVFGVAYVFYYPALGNMPGAGQWSSQTEWNTATDRHYDRFAQLYKGYAGQSPDVLVDDRRAMQTGRRLFLNYCSTCHGVAAKGSDSFPDLTDSEWIWGADFDAIKHTIVNGRQAAMPPWSQVIAPDKMAELSAYVSSMSSAEFTATATSKSSNAGDDSGKTTYSTFCVACHGIDGKGNPALGAPDLTNDVWLYGGSSEDITESIAEGRNGMMPAHGAIIGDDKAHLLAAYVLSLQKQHRVEVSQMIDRPDE